MLKLSQLYGGKVQNPKYRRSDTNDAPRTSAPQRTASLTRVKMIAQDNGDDPFMVTLVRATPTMVIQINTFVGRRTTARAARLREARSGQRLRRGPGALGFSLAGLAD